MDGRSLAPQTVFLVIDATGETAAVFSTEQAAEAFVDRMHNDPPPDWLGARIKGLWVSERLVDEHVNAEPEAAVNGR